MKFRNLFFALVATVGFNTASKAQDYDLGVFVGASFYNGDLYSLDNGLGNAFRGFRPAIGALARYNFTPRLAVRGNLNFGYIGGYDKYGSKGTDRESRNLSFHSPLLELSVMGEFNILKYIAGTKKHKFAPYLFAGVGVAYFEPKAYLDGERYKLRELATEENKSYSPITLAIPMGLGFKYNIKDNWTLGLEFGWRMTTTDYLDDVSTKYPASAYTVDANSPPADQLSNRTGGTVGPNTTRGNPGSNDSYYFVGFTIYKTIRKYSCNNF